MHKKSNASLSKNLFLVAESRKGFLHFGKVQQKHRQIVIFFLFHDRAAERSQTPERIKQKVIRKYSFEIDEFADQLYGSDNL